jgi:two-component system NtrC family sensor kinase
MKRSAHSIGVKLFGWIFGSMALIFVTASYFTFRGTSRAWIESFEQHAAQTSAVIERALRYGMLLNRKDEVHAALRNIAREPGIRSIRVYDKLGRIMFSSDAREVGRKVDRTAEACVTCHDPDEPLEAVPNRVSSRVFRDAGGALLMGHIYPIKNAPQCSTASCHAHSSRRTVLGVLDVTMSMDAIRVGQLEAEKTTFYATVLMALVGGLVTAVLIWKFVRLPVLRLVEGTRKVAGGDLSAHIDLGVKGELGELASAFNHMTDDLARAREHTQKWEEELERAVDEKTEKLTSAQRQLTQMERMASLGKLSATVAHELNNPLAGILVYAKLIKREIAGDELSVEGKAEALRYVDVISQETARCGDIVKNLLVFAREARTQFIEQQLNPVIDRAVMTVRHLIKHASLDLVVEPVVGDDRFVGDANQIQQALVALLVNAIEAMPDGGELALRAKSDNGHLSVEVTDTGIGIPPDVLPHVFEPFVSTKGAEKGVGLGLAIVYGIVTRHRGTIEVESEVNKGTKFVLCLPRDPLTAEASGEGPSAE